MTDHYLTLPQFSPFTDEHYFALFLATLVGYLIIRYAKNKLSEDRQHNLAVSLSIFIALNVLAYIIIKLSNGTFDFGTELPFNICNLSALLLPFVVWKKNRRFSGVLYFWIMAGTLQANLTPDLNVGFPHYFYFKYWIVHSGLVIIALYLVFVYRFIPRKEDLKSAFILAQIYFVFIVILNLAIDGNYLYIMKKPDTSTILDYMGPWPWYILSGELLMIILFILLLLPFEMMRRRSIGNNDRLELQNNDQEMIN